MVQNRPERDNLAWLQIVLAVVAGAALTLLYFLVRGNSDGMALPDLILGLAPNLISALLVVVVVYYVLARRGIPTARALVDEVREAARSGSAADDVRVGVLAFYPNSRNVPWVELLDKARSIDIVVCYWDSWVKANWEALQRFFGRGGSMRIFLPDPRVASALNVVAERFPEHSRSNLHLKILNTGVRLGETIRSSGSQSARLEVHFFPGSVNFSSTRVDGKLLLLSVYEQFREGRIGSSMTVLDIEANDHLRGYWDKEYGGFARRSELVSDAQLRAMVSEVRQE